jgi:hypothetical protein
MNNRSAPTTTNPSLCTLRYEYKYKLQSRRASAVLCVAPTHKLKLPSHPNYPLYDLVHPFVASRLWPFPASKQQHGQPISSSSIHLRVATVARLSRRAREGSSCSRACRSLAWLVGWLAEVDGRSYHGYKVGWLVGWLAWRGSRHGDQRPRRHVEGPGAGRGAGACWSPS